MWGDSRAISFLGMGFFVLMAGRGGSGGGGIQPPAPSRLQHHTLVHLGKRDAGQHKLSP